MPKQTILVKVFNRVLGLSGPGPIYTCTKLTVTERRDGAGNFRAEFPATDERLSLISLKNTYLEFEVGGQFFFLGLVERIVKVMDRKGRQNYVVSGRDQLGALAENSIGFLELNYAFDAHEQIIGAANVPNQTFTVAAESNFTTATPYTKKFSGESALAALVKVANDTGEHFYTPKRRELSVVWLGPDTPDAPVRLVAAGGPRLHENSDVAIIEQVESDQNADMLLNRIHPYGAGTGEARLTLEAATIAMPSGFSMDTAANYIQRDGAIGLPNVLRKLHKSFNHIGITGEILTLAVTADTASGATLVPVELVGLPIPDGTLLDLNGLGVDFVELSANVSVGANVLNVVATGFDLFENDELVYTPAEALEGASNQLAYAALAHLQRVSDLERMVAYKLIVRGLPDSVHVGMKIPVLAQAPQFAIDDDLIILEITREVTREGRMPTVVRVVPVDWFDQSEGAMVATAIEEFHNFQRQDQPLAYASVEDPPDLLFTNLGDTFASYSGLGGRVIKVNAGETGLEAVAGGFTQEEIEDFVAAQLTGNTGVIGATYNDGTGAITLTLDVSAADRILYSTAADTWAEATLTAFARTLLDDADLATAQATLQVTAEHIQDIVGAMVTGNTETLISVTYQDSDGTLDFEITDAELTALAGLTSAADRLPYFTGSGTAALATFTSFARTLVDDADAAAARTTLELTQEHIEDYVGAMVSSNTETGIAVTYDDSTGKLNFDAQTAGDARYLKIDGTTALSGDWDAGEDRAIKLEFLQARDAEGITFRDDNGAEIGEVSDAGDWGFGITPYSDIRLTVADGTARIRIESTTNSQTAAFILAGKGASGTVRGGGFYFTPHETANSNFFGFSADNSTFQFNIYPNRLEALQPLSILQPTLGSAVLTLSSTATNDDPTEATIQARVATTNGTITTLATIPIAASTTYYIEIVGSARRTGGSAGATDDAAGWRLTGTVKNLAGTATILGGGFSGAVNKDVAGWDVTVVASGSNILLRVTGATNTNITWHSTMRIYPVSS